MTIIRLLVGVLIIAGTISCQQAAPPEEKKADSTAAWEYKPHTTLLDVMRAVPFPNSNIIFDTQSSDPAVPKKPSTSVDTGSATSTYSTTYGGWMQVEYAAKALSETANLIMIPGRKCDNGLDVPLNDATFRKAAQGLIDAGEAAYKAAKSRNLDTMVEVSGTVSDACLACHEKYRDVPPGAMRCVSENAQTK
jgi:hypothetical protein